MGGILFEPKTPELLEKAVDLRNTLDEDFWLGARDNEIEGEWRWASNGELVEQNVHAQAVNLNQNCMDMNEGGEFHDHNCRKTLKYVCEIN